VGILAIKDHKPTLDFIANYKDHWLYQRLRNDELPEGPIYRRMRILHAPPRLRLRRDRSPN
jgi:hypothetical protein